MNYSSASNYRQNGERHLLNSLKNYLSNEKSITIFDVGANVGDYSNSVIEIFNDSTFHLTSFEPLKSTFEQLRKNVQNSENINLINKGLSNKEDKLIIHFDKEASKLTSLYPRKLDHVNIDFSLEEEIEVTTLDVYCSQNAIEKIHFLKIDVEGHEMEVFNGAEKLIENKNIDFIQFEFGGTNIDSRTFFRDFFSLLNAEFRIYRIVKDGIVELTKYSEALEVYLSCNYLAVRKEIDFHG
ncbi:MAG: FkbM family methyltransferase [Cyclobacteriaceae bacterium]|jgi:FkbM family methyltransferase|nr:FkbM family methyltransferase [Cyclobacteriaceae bacterium]